MRIRAWMVLTVMILAGLGLIGYAAWDLLGNQGNVRDRQSVLEDEFRVSTGDNLGAIGAGALVKPPKPLPGSALARIRVPALGQEWVVVEGTEPGDIATAPGHYEFSALPGQVGNFAVAGHREPGLFWDLDKMRNGDEIIVESRRGTFTYIVTKNFITHPQSWREVGATPPGFARGDRVLTLTTCNPKWDNFQRLVVHAVIKV